MMPIGSPSTNGKRLRGRPPKIVKYHKAKRQHFATLPVNGRAEYFYGDTEPEVLEKYNRRLAELQNVTRGMSDDEAESELLAAGVPEEVIEGNPELLRIAKRGVLVLNSKWLDEHPDSPLARLRENKRREKKGLPPLPLTPGESVDDRPATSKRRLSDCLSCWREWKQAEGCKKVYIDDVSQRQRPLPEGFLKPPAMRVVDYCARRIETPVRTRSVWRQETRYAGLSAAERGDLNRSRLEPDYSHHRSPNILLSRWTRNRTFCSGDEALDRM